jgi:SAM-dependent methyltransferase
MEWWRDLFTAPLWQRVQRSWEEADDADEDAARIARALQLRVGDRVLDAPCGTGRIARRLQAQGFPCVGIDATPRFLHEASAAGVPVIEADMRTAVVRSDAFDAAICVWGSFGYFGEDGNGAQARCLADALIPGGRCLIDTLASDTLLPRFAPDASWDVADVQVDEHRRYDEAAKRIETSWTFTAGEQRERRTTSVRLYSVAALTDLLADAGFSSFQALDGDLRPFGESSERLWLVATKPG